MDVFQWAVARHGRWAGRDYLKARNRCATRFKPFYPYEERRAGRPVRTTPAYALYRDRRAVLGASDGIGDPLWFAPEGMEAADTPTFRRPNWFEPVGEECRGLAAGVGIIGISTCGIAAAGRT